MGGVNASAAANPSRPLAWPFHCPQVLTAKVYDVAVETPLEKAEKLRWAGRAAAVLQGGCQGREAAAGRFMFARRPAWAVCACRVAAEARAAAAPPCPALALRSEALGSTILLKREDLQVGGWAGGASSRAAPL